MSGESLIFQCVCGFQDCCSVLQFSISFNLFIILVLSLCLSCCFFSSPSPHFNLPTLRCPSPPPPPPSRCVNQYSLLTHDSPHMFCATQDLHLGAEIVYVCVHMNECNFDVSSFLFCLSFNFCACAHVCAWVCAWKSTRLASAFSKGLLLSAQINLLSPWVNTLIHLCIWVHVVCVHVYVSMLIQGRALPNTPWKHSIHQQLEAGALGPALHFHWERGRQRRKERREDRRRIWG